MIEVTAGIIQNPSNEVLITRRKAGKHLAGYWEFPGGKIEAGESPESCLVREIKEELNITIEVRAHLMDSEHHYDAKSIRLKGYMAEFIEGEIHLTDHDEFAWASLEALENYNFAPADIPLIKKLTHGL